MKTVYNAANVLEAQMLLDVLRQEGITAHLRGAYLQGGMGELPAAGLVRLEVDEEDHLRAREAIDRWEAASPVPDTPVGATADGSGARSRWALPALGGTSGSIRSAPSTAMASLFSQIWTRTLMGSWTRHPLQAQQPRVGRGGSGWRWRDRCANAVPRWRGPHAGVR